MERTLRKPVIAFGDRLDLETSGLDEFDPLRDAVRMAEVADPPRGGGRECMM